MSIRNRLPVLATLVVGGSVLALSIYAPGWVSTNLNWGIATVILVSAAVAGFFFEFEARNLGSKEVALVAVMGTVSAVARIPFAAIPNVQPATFLIICMGYVFGPMAGFMTGAVTAIVSNFFLGHGPWTLFQIFAWGLGGVIAGGLGRIKAGVWALAAFGLVWGFVFGIIMNLWFWVSLIYPLNLTTFLASQLNSFWFDALHAMANFILVVFAGKKVIGIMENWHNRFYWTHVQEHP